MVKKLTVNPIVRVQSTFRGQRMILYTDRARIVRYGKPKVIHNEADGVFVGFYKNKKLTRVFNVDDL